MANIPPDAVATRVYDLCRLYLRSPDSIATDAASGNPVVVFVPVLTAGEQTTFNRILNIAKSLVTGISPAEWQALEPDIATCVTFLGIASPTLVQTAAAVKAHMRITRAMLKN